MVGKAFPWMSLLVMMATVVNLDVRENMSLKAIIDMRKTLFMFNLIKTPKS